MTVIAEDQDVATRSDERSADVAAKAHADDAAGKAREVREGLDRAPWIRDLIPFDAQTLAVLNQAEAQTAFKAEWELVKEQWK